MKWHEINFEKPDPEGKAKRTQEGLCGGTEARLRPVRSRRGGTALIVSMVSDTPRQFCWNICEIGKQFSPNTTITVI